MQSLERSVSKRIVERLERAAERPEHYVERLVGSDERKLRIGDFRLLAALSQAERVIIVERVDHRRRVYKR